MHKCEQTLVFTVNNEQHQYPISIRYGGGAFSFSRLITGITANFNTEFDLKLVNTFKDSITNLGSGARAFQQSIEKINLNINWMAKNSKIVQDWLETMS